MPDISFSNLRDLKQKLIRKPLAGMVLMADTTVAIPAALSGTAPGGIIDLKTAGFKSVGHISKDASPTFTPETKTSEVESWGLLESARTDMISRTTNISWTGQETHALNLSLYHNVDLSAVKSDATTGETEVIDPTDPAIIYHRAIFLTIDGAGANTIYIAKIAPRFVITEVAEQSWKQEDAITYQITGRAKLDEDEGYAMKTVFFGPGWKDIAVEAGFPASTP